MKEATDEVLDAMVREDMALGGQIAEREHGRNLRIRVLTQRIRETEEACRRDTAAWRTRRGEIRGEILAAWQERGDPGTVLDLPSAKVVRRHRSRMTVVDPDALYGVLDRADRLDLASHRFEEKAILALVTKGQLKGADGAVRVIRDVELQIVPKGGPDAEG